MTKIINLLWLLLCFSSRVSAQEISPEVEKSLVVLKSSKEYVLAKQTAEEASKILKIRLDLRGLSENKKTGLSFDKKTCLDGPMQEYPCYFRRGKFDDGEYVSVEYSSDYKEMKPKLYIVVIYSGDTKKAKTIVNKAKPFYGDAYQKKIKIYMAGE